MRAIDDVLADLIATRDAHLGEIARHQAAADKLDTAIAALRGVEGEPAASDRYVFPTTSEVGKMERPAVAPRAPRADKPESHANRPLTGTCDRAGCAKTFRQPKQGRPRHYCSVGCGKKARKAGAAIFPTRAVPDVDELLSPPPPIPESGGAMRDRIRRAKVGRPTFLDRARERNEEAARRNGVARAS